MEEKQMGEQEGNDKRIAPGMKALNLEEMTEGEAMDLVGKVAGRLDEAERRAVAQACGRLPLALRVVASLLERRADLGVGELLGRVRDAERRLKLSGVEAALQTSYELLAEDLQERWRMLGVFVGSFERGAAAAVWGTDEETTSDVLGELLGYSLVGYVDGRYRLHELARDFAGVKLGEGYEVRLRHAGYYCEVLQRADELYLQGGEGVMAGLGLYDVEAENILAGQLWTAGQEGEEAARLCNAYPDAGANVIALRLHPREQIAWLEAGMTAARRLGRREYEGWHLGNLGVAYKNLGEIKQAIGYYEESLVIAREIGDRRAEGANLGDLAAAYHSLGEVRRAIGYYEERLALAREIGSRRAEGADLCNLGIAYKDMGEMRRAIEYYEESLVIYREVGDRQGEGACLCNLGLAYKGLGEVGRAIECYEEYLKIAREIGDQQGEGNALGNLGLAYADLGEVKQAIRYYEGALVIEREISDRWGEGNALGNLGVAYKDLGEVRRAIGYYEEALVIAREIGDRRGEGNALDSLGLAYADLGEVRRAIGYYEGALVIVREVGDRRAEARVLWNLALAEEKVGKLGRAIALTEESLRLREVLEGMDVEMVRRALAEWRGN